MKRVLKNAVAMLCVVTLVFGGLSGFVCECVKADTTVNMDTEYSESGKVGAYTINASSFVAGVDADDKYHVAFRLKGDDDETSPEDQLGDANIILDFQKLNSQETYTVEWNINITGLNSRAVHYWILLEYNSLSGTPIYSVPALVEGEQTLSFEYTLSEESEGKLRAFLYFDNISHATEIELFAPNIYDGDGNQISAKDVAVSWDISPDDINEESSDSKVSNEVKNTAENLGEVSALKTKAPGKAAIKKATKSGEKVSVKLKKAEGASGYEVYLYKTKKNAKKNKKVVAKADSSKISVSLKSKKIKKAKKLFVRSRAYIKNSGAKIYGGWSVIKKVK